MESTFDLASYDYALPPELIAQTPAEPRDAARLLVLHRSTGQRTHRHVRDLPELLRPGDLLVANRTRVLPSRIQGTKAGSGGRVELLLLRPVDGQTWESLAHGHRLRTGQLIQLPGSVQAEIGEVHEGTRLVRFPPACDVPGLLSAYGEMPLPPYIHGYTGDQTRYQTVYAAVDGSAAAPTAGLHFTPELIDRLQSCGIGWATVLLHVGLDTFRPVTESDVRHHHIHTEWIDVDDDVVQQVDACKARGGRVVAVGTTSVRALEHAAAGGQLRPYRGPADLYIVPGYRFRVVDVLLTNFHLPRTSLLLLVSALADRPSILDAYADAIQLRYRFFSFGDAMLIV